MPTQASDRALVVIAHGSRRDSANREFFDLVERIGERNPDYAITRPALLEQAPPSLLQACRALPDAIGAIDVYPLFFNCGRHVEQDIPALMEEVRSEMPDREVRLLPYFGSSDAMADWVLQHTRASQ